MVLYSFSHSGLYLSVEIHGLMYRLAECFLTVAPESVPHYYNQEYGSLYAYPSEQFLQTGQCGLGFYQVIEGVHRNSFSPCAYLIHISAYCGYIVLFKIPHCSVQKGGSQRCSNTCSYETQYTQCLEEVFERNTYRYIYSERYIQHAITYTAYEIRKVEAFNVQVGVNEEIHVVLVCRKQTEAYENKHLESFVLYHTTVEHYT